MAWNNIAPAAVTCVVAVTTTALPGHRGARQRPASPFRAHTQMLVAKELTKAHPSSHLQWRVKESMSVFAVEVR